MTLFSLLTDRRTEILAKCEEKMREAFGSRSSTYPLDEGLNKLYEELIEVLRISLENPSPELRHKFVSDTITVSASREHARESFRLGFTVSQLVHGYGSICQGITEYAHEAGAQITSAEFGQLNMALDVAIAQSVTVFDELNVNRADSKESMRLGVLAHELRNALSSGMVANELIKRGDVGHNGATGALLTQSLYRMKDIIDRAIAEVRMGAVPQVDLARFQVFGLLSEIESTALPEAHAKNIALRVDCDLSLMIEADRHLVTSAIANLVQNAIKFGKPGSNVSIRAFPKGADAIIEVEDRCGGLLEGKTETIFEPFVQDNEDRSGLGLGLSIARRAIELHKGSITAVNIRDLGCVFTICLPAYVAEASPASIR